MVGDLPIHTFHTRHLDGCILDEDGEGTYPLLIEVG